MDHGQRPCVEHKFNLHLHVTGKDCTCPTTCTDACSERDWHTQHVRTHVSSRIPRDTDINLLSRESTFLSACMTEVLDGMASVCLLLFSFEYAKTIPAKTCLLSAGGHSASQRPSNERLRTFSRLLLRSTASFHIHTKTDFKQKQG